jgi:hypothetical protein
MNDKFVYFFKPVKRWIKFKNKNIYFVNHESKATFGSKKYLKHLLTSSSVNEDVNFTIKNYEKFILKKINTKYMKNNKKNNQKIIFPDRSIINAESISKEENCLNVIWVNKCGVKHHMYLPTDFKYK